jgi:MFS transporter, DHA1 family, multidrug resistance protein
LTVFFKLWSPLAEIPILGRNIPYIVTYALFVIFAVPTALSNSLATLLILRFLTGFLGSPCLATAPASFGDIYSFIQLPYALTAWLAACFGGPALGPLISGFAVSSGHWRWALWEILLMSGPVWVLMFFFLPETSASTILLNRARRLRKLTGNEKLRSQSEIDQGNTTLKSVVMMALVKPFEISIKDPAVLFTHLYASFTYGIYYSFFEAFPIAYISIYGFSIGIMGVAFICILIGCLIAVVIYVAYQHFYLIPDLKKRGPRQQEHRLVPAIFASMLIPSCMFWFGWTVEKDIHYLVSLAAITFWCVGSFLVFQCVFMYLAMSYPTYAASLFAANDACRSALAGGAVIFGRPLYNNLGLGRGSSILGGLQIGGVIGIIALWYWGAWLRSRSKFALS